MKQRLGFLLTALLALTVSISKAQYIDLSTGQSVELVKHQGNGMMLDVKTQRPVYLYINNQTGDTMYGRTAAVVNGKLTKSSTGAFMFEDEDGYIYKDGEYRMKTEADSAGYRRKMQSDGDVKVKYDGYKRKVESDGDVKEKETGAKTKVELDGTIKRKDGDFRGKIDKEGNIRLKDDNTKIKAKVDGKMKVKDKQDDAKVKVDEDDGDIKIKEHGEKRKIKGEKDKAKSAD